MSSTTPAPNIAAPRRSLAIDAIVIAKRFGDNLLACKTPKATLRSMRGSVAPAFAALITGVVIAACGGEHSSSAPTTPFTVWVFDERLTMDGSDKPVAGVPVAFDPAGGGDRITSMTELDGHVTFDADFSQGPASVSVFSPDHVFVTMLEASPESANARPNTSGKPPGDLVIMPPRLDSVTTGLTVGLSGNIFGKKHPQDSVALFTSGLPRVGTVQTADPVYMMRAPRGRPFFVLGHAFDSLLDSDGNVAQSDLLQSFRIDLPARSDDERLDLDLATVKALPIQLLHLHAESPKGAVGSFVSGTRAYASVQSADSGVTPGIFISTNRSPDGRAFDITVKVAQTDIAPERPLTQAVLLAPDGSRSIRTEQGIAKDGTSWTDFPAPPTIADPDVVRGLADPIPLDGFPAGADMEVDILAANQLFWVLRGPPGGPRAKSFTIPRQDVIDAKDVVLFAVSVSARMDRVVLPLHGEIYRRVGVFRDISLRK